jgi:hypothetical protein
VRGLPDYRVTGEIMNYPTRTFTRSPLGQYRVEGELPRGTRKCRVDMIVMREGRAITHEGSGTFTAKRAEQVVRNAILCGQTRAAAYTIVPLLVDSNEQLMAQTRPDNGNQIEVTLP